MRLVAIMNFNTQSIMYSVITPSVSDAPASYEGDRKAMLLCCKFLRETNLAIWETIVLGRNIENMSYQELLDFTKMALIVYYERDAVLYFAEINDVINIE